MNFPALGRLGCCGLVLLCCLWLAFQRPFRVYPSMERYDDIPLPPDFQEKTEWVFAPPDVPPAPPRAFRPLTSRRFGGGFDWRQGFTSWTQDYPRADRHFAAALRRLTRVHARSVEQPVNPDDRDDFYNWPWMNAGEMGDWKLTESQARPCANTCCAAASSCSTISGEPRSGTASTKACGWFSHPNCSNIGCRR